MAVTHPDAVRNAMCDWVVDQLDVGGAGKLIFRTGYTNAQSPGTAVATLPLSSTAFGSGGGAPASTTGLATANSITSDTNATGNASAVNGATLTKNDGTTVIVGCAVTASSGDINMTGGLTVGAGDTVSCSALTYAAAP